MELLANIVCRPTRVLYSLEDLGPAHFALEDGTRVQRVDLEVASKLGTRLQCSHYMQEGKCVRVCDMPVVIYLHGSGSSRLEACDCIEYLLQNGISLFSFDFSGAGISTGDICSLGIRESVDVQSVVEFLCSQGHGSIGLWARSMGAVAGLMVASSEVHGPLIDVAILDSCFLNLEQVANEIASSRIKSNLSNISITQLFLAAGARSSSPHPQSPAHGGNLLIEPLADTVVGLLRTCCSSEAGFDIREVDVASTCHRCKCPLMFVAADEDTIVHPYHSIELFGLCSNSSGRELVFVPGGHNTERPHYFKESAVEFLQNAFSAAASAATSENEADLVRSSIPVHSTLARREESPSASRPAKTHTILSPNTNRTSSNMAITTAAGHMILSPPTAASKASSRESSRLRGKKHPAKCPQPPKILDFSGSTSVTPSTPTTPTTPRTLTNLTNSPSRTHLRSPKPLKFSKKTPLLQQARPGKENTTSSTISSSSPAPRSPSTYAWKIPYFAVQHRDLPMTPQGRQQKNESARRKIVDDLIYRCHAGIGFTSVSVGGGFGGAGGGRGGRMGVLFGVGEKPFGPTAGGEGGGLFQKVKMFLGRGAALSNELQRHAVKKARRFGVWRTRSASVLASMRDSFSFSLFNLL